MMADKTDFLLALKKRLALGEISEAEYNRFKAEIMADEKDSVAGADSFDARATFQGIGPKMILKNRYEVISELGRGGMGVVYKAKDLELETVVAVKVLGDELARDGRSVRNLIEEAKISMRLAHPHIMRLINFESDDRRKFLVMEFIDGETLEARLAREGKIAESALVQIASDICEGLGYAHKKKIIHRDIKPSNIMLTNTGEVKLMDFGIARVMKDSMTMVTGRTTTGTLIYMSPEQIRGKDVDERSDIYSLGITLYELISGAPPFISGDITFQHLNEAPKPIGNISARLNAIILRCLAKNKNDRFKSAYELLAELKNCLNIGVLRNDENIEHLSESSSDENSRSKIDIDKSTEPGLNSLARSEANSLDNIDKETVIKSLPKIAGFILLFAALFLLLCLISYDSQDPSWANAVATGRSIRNIGGRVGAWLAEAAFQLLGLASLLLPFMLGYLGLKAVLVGEKKHLWRKAGTFALAFLILGPMLNLLLQAVPWRGTQIQPGGLMSDLINSGLIGLLNTTGALIFLLVGLVLFLIYLSGNIRRSLFRRFLKRP